MKRQSKAHVARKSRKWSMSNVLVVEGPSAVEEILSKTPVGDGKRVLDRVTSLAPTLETLVVSPYWPNMRPRIPTFQGNLPNRGVGLSAQYQKPQCIYSQSETDDVMSVEKIPDLSDLKTPEEAQPQPA